MNLVCDPVRNVCVRGSAQADARTRDGAAPSFDAPPARPAAVSLSPATQDFGMVAAGGTGPSLTFTVSNDGDVASGAIVAAIDGDAASFAITGGTCAGATLGGGAQCTVLVQFHPAGAAGGKQATLRVTSPEDEANAALTGAALAPGVVTLTPASATFGPLALGGHEERPFTVRNTGEAATRPLAVALATDPRFAITGNDCPATLAGGASCRVAVTFTPTSVGVAQGIALTVTENGGGSAAATLAGTGVARVVVTNAGGGAVASAPDGVSCGATCTASFSESPVRLTATPDDRHTFTGWSGACTGTAACSVPLDAAETAVTATFALIPAALTVNPDRRGFGSLVIGATSPAATFTVTNGGGAETAALAVAVSSPSFTLRGGTCAGTKLASRQSCTVLVSFTPGGEPGARSASLTVTGLPAETVSATLTGTALAPGALAITPGSHDFGTQVLGGSTDATTFTVENTGQSATGAVTVALSDDTHFTIAASDCGPALAAGASCTVDVAFAPGAVGDHGGVSLTVSATPGGSVAAGLEGTGTAAVNVTAGAGGTVDWDPARIQCGATCTASFTQSPIGLTATPDALHTFGGWSGACTGTGDCDVVLTATTNAVTARFELKPAALAVAPTTQSFGSVVLGGAGEPIPFTVSNPGGATTGALSATLTDGASYTVTGGTCPGQTLAPAASCTVLVRFNPTGAAGAKPATLTVAASPGGDTTAALTGTALTPGELSLTPTTRDFGSLAIGSTSTAQQFTVENEGGAPTGNLTASLSDSTHFTITDNGCAAPLPAGGTCTVSVAFAPTSIGLKQGVSLNVAASPGGSVAATLRGTGTARLTVANAGGGTVTSDPAAISCGATCSATFSASPVLRAQPLATHTFGGWSGGGCSGTGTCTPTLATATQTVTATFDELPACSFITVNTLAGNGQLAAVDNADGLMASLALPTFLALDGAGALYVTGLTGIRIVQPNGATSTLSQFLGVSAIGRDATGKLYLTGSNEFTAGVGTLIPGGNFVSLISNPIGYVDGAATVARFQFQITGPNSLMAVAGIRPTGDGAMIVSDPGNHRVRRIAADGTTSTLAGNGQTSVLNGPSDLVLDAAGNVYVADTHGHVIRRITPAGAITTVAGTGVAGFRDGASGVAQFNHPFGVTRDAAGNLYVADTLNHRIRRIAADGRVTTLAGGAQGFSPGTTTGCNALFNTPHALVVSGNKLHVADRSNQRIRTVFLP